MLDDDGLQLDEVGAWAKDKHDRLRKYVDISRAARRKFVEGSGGATYIDLFCGSGRAVLRETGETINGSPLIAFRCAREGGVPFSEIHIADADEGKCVAAARRIENAGGQCATHVGPAEDTAARIVANLNKYGLHFAFLDPFNLDDLPFSVIEAFSRLKRIDMLIHVSAQDLQRNLDIYSVTADGPLDHFAPGWRKVVDINQSKSATRAAYIAYWASKMEALGLPPARRAELVSGTTKNQRLYWLVFVSRSEFAKGLWDKIRSVSGQGELL
ncbi:MAG: three-Cys-motif partner protein TcmP [Pseudolabrys sp.]|nr:three-Cys-motif partner protein TcmP [Pseudolabrys sp.]